jgi:hypothetical protein
VQKLHLCAFTFDFSNPSRHVREKEVKRQTLLELVDYANSGQGKFTEAVSEDIVFMLASNLFRTLPPTRAHDADNFDPEEEEPTLEPAWPHLQARARARARGAGGGLPGGTRRPAVSRGVWGGAGFAEEPLAGARRPGVPVGAGGPGSGGDGGGRRRWASGPRAPGLSQRAPPRPAPSPYPPPPRSCTSSCCGTSCPTTPTPRSRKSEGALGAGLFRGRRVSVG